MTKYYKYINSEYYIKSVKINAFLYAETHLDLEKFNYTHNYGKIGFQQVATFTTEDLPIEMDDYEEISSKEWNKAVDNFSKALKA